MYGCEDKQANIPFYSVLLPKFKIKMSTLSLKH